MLLQNFNVAALVVALTWACFAPTSARALEAGDWKIQQTLAIEQPGLIKLALPPATFNSARPGLADVRLLDPSARETPFLIDSSPPLAPAGSVNVKSFRAALAGQTSSIVIETGTSEPIEALTLSTPAPHFIKAARVESSPDGQTWQLVSDGAPLFRQFGVEQLRLPLGQRAAAFVRVTLDDARTAPVPFTAASVHLVRTAPAANTTTLDLRISRRDEFAGETVLTLDLGAANLPFAEFAFATTDSLFARRVSFTVRELQADTATERTLGRGSIYRIAADGLPPASQLGVPVDFTAPSRELLVHIANGDSPPLVIESISAKLRTHWLVFRAAESGTYRLLTGNAQISAPRYDLPALAAVLKSAAPSRVTLGPAEANPAYRKTEVLAATPLTGAPIDLSGWSRRRTVTPTQAGVQELELDLDVLAGAQPNLADLRLVRDATQLPYLLERTSLARTLALQPTPLPPVASRPHSSRWQITPPFAGSRFDSLTLQSPSPLFRRRFRVLDARPDSRGDVMEIPLADIDWIRTPGDSSPLRIALNNAAVSTLILECDNGDNPPITLSSAVATYPVVRLLFKTTHAPLALYYGNTAVSAPRYDLALVAPQILAAEKSLAALTATDAAGAGNTGWKFRSTGVYGGIIFWGALGLVVVALLVVVAKLLPKPPAA